MPRERVTVVTPGAVRLYEMNGHGLREWATILADLTAEDAASLTLALDGFLAGRDRSRPPEPIAALETPRKALPAPESQAPRALPHGSLLANIVDYLNEHGPSRPEAIHEGIGASTRGTVRDALSRLKRYGRARPAPHIGRGVWESTDNVATRPLPKERKPPSATLEEDYAKILAYVEEHPGVLRTEIGTALGMDRIYVANRLFTLVKRGEVRQEKAGDPTHPNAVTVWKI